MDVDKKVPVSLSKKVLNIASNLLFITLMAIIMLLMFMVVKGTITGQEPQIFSYKMYSVRSGSMSPAIKVGSLIIVEMKETADINIQDIVTYKASKSILVTHRVVDIASDGSGYITRGDANKTNDPMVLKKENIVGKVVLAIPYAGAFFDLLRTKTGIVLLIVITAFAVITSYIIEDYKKDNQVLFKK